MIRLDTMLKMAVAWRWTFCWLWSRATCLRLELFTLHRRFEVSSLIHDTIVASVNAECVGRWLTFWDEKGESYNREWTKQRWNIVVNRTLKRVLSPHNICLSAANSKLMLRSNLIHQKSGLELVELNNIGWDQHVFRFFSSEQHTWRQFVFLKLYYNSSSW